MTIQEALNEAAKNQGYKNWNEVENKPVYGGSSIRAIACKAMELYAEAKAKEFAEWVNENYTLVTSEELQKSAWVNLKRSVYVNGSDFHYTQMINEFGETNEQLYEKFKTQ